MLLCSTLCFIHSYKLFSSGPKHKGIRILGLIEKEDEDGICHDPARIDYHRRHIQCMKEAVEEGVNLFGYTTWGCIDLVSAGTGQMDKKYGFIYVDKDDQGKGDLHRLKKDSFYWYKKVIASDGQDLD